MIDEDFARMTIIKPPAHYAMQNELFTKALIHSKIRPQTLKHCPRSTLVT